MSDDEKIDNVPSFADELDQQRLNEENNTPDLPKEEPDEPEIIDDEIIHNYQSFADELDRENQNENNPDHESQAKQTPDIATKAELDHLHQARDQPVLTTDLTMGGEMERRVHEDINLEREDRIRYLEERLDAYKNRARDDFNLTQQHHDMREIEGEDR